LVGVPPNSCAASKTILFFVLPTTKTTTKTTERIRKISAFPAARTTFFRFVNNFRVNTFAARTFFWFVSPTFSVLSATFVSIHSQQKLFFGLSRQLGRRKKSAPPTNSQQELFFGLSRQFGRPKKKCAANKFAARTFFWFVPPIWLSEKTYNFVANLFAGKLFFFGFANLAIGKKQQVGCEQIRSKNFLWFVLPTWPSERDKTSSANNRKKGGSFFFF